MYVQYMWYSTYVQMYIYDFQALVHTNVCMISICVCAVISVHVLLVCIYIRIFTILLYMHVVYLLLPHVMHCWLSALYRTGLIKDLLLCSGYRDSSSLRPS